jgi:hypothetical protein
VKPRETAWLLPMIGLLAGPCALRAPECLAQNSTPESQYEAAEPLSEKVNDPTAALTQFQFQDQYTPAQYGTNAQPNTFFARFVIAIRPHGIMPFEQIVRPTINLAVTKPDGRGSSTSTGFGDTQIFDLLLSPWPDPAETRFRWGLGPYFVLPTASSRLSGQGAWQSGPAAAFEYRGIPGLQIGGLMQQATSFSYTSEDRTPVTSITFQPLLSYQLGRGWYIESNKATWTFNLRHNTSTEIPLSLGIGRVWQFAGSPALNTSVAGEWMAYRQFAPQTQQFTLKFQATLLFPKHKL